jgi:hypothetical protein
MGEMQTKNRKSSFPFLCANSVEKRRKRAIAAANYGIGTACMADSVVV